MILDPLPESRDPITSKAIADKNLTELAPSLSLVSTYFVDGLLSLL